MWEAANIAKRENAGDGIHNIGTAYEIQGYDLLMKQERLEKVRPYFRRAAEYFEKSAAVDPEEKYVTRAAERTRKALQLVDAFDQLERARQKALAANVKPSSRSAAEPAVPPSDAPENPATDPAAEEALAKALDDPRADTEQETLFRQFVRLRVRSASAALEAAAKKQIESTGAMAYGLTALAARRVVHQETQTWATDQPKFTAYRESYNAFAQDGRISSEERNALQILAKNLGLSDGEVKAIESAK